MLAFNFSVVFLQVALFLFAVAASLLSFPPKTGKPFLPTLRRKGQKMGFRRSAYMVAAYTDFELHLGRC